MLTFMHREGGMTIQETNLNFSPPNFLVKMAFSQKNSGDQIRFLGKLLKILFVLNRN